MANYIFFHVYCNKNTFRILVDMISKIIYSNLYHSVDKIYTFLTGEVKYINQCINYIINCGKKFDITEIGINDNTAERFTLLKMKNYLKDEDKFLYIHSKGVIRSIEHEMTCYINDWRYLMEYFLITKFELCLKELDNYDVVGVNYKNHFSGNFWWSKGVYFKTLQNFIEDYYTAPEDYIFKTTVGSPKIKCLHSSGLEGFGHYYNGYPWCKYIDNN